jgi:hypothetical protein
MISNIGVYDHGDIGFERPKPILQQDCIILGSQFVFPNLENNKATVLSPNFVRTTGADYIKKCSELGQNNILYSSLDIFVFDNTVTEKYLLDYFRRYIERELKDINIKACISVSQTKTLFRCVLTKFDMIVHHE